MPVSEVGELAVNGPQVMLGYWNRPGATVETLRDGWLYTGDIARMDENGFFYIVDRKKDLIIAGGFAEVCRQHLASYKVPRLVELRDDLPKSLVGKVLQRVLREEEATANTSREVG